MCGARGEANTSFLGRTERKKPDFRLWHAILRTIAVFLAPRTVFMSVKPVRWPKKLVVVLSTHVGRQRAHPLVPNLNLKKAVFYNWPPLRRAFAVLTLGPTSMATCLLHCRPRDGEAPCTVAQRLRYGMFLPPPPMGRHSGRARAVGVLAAERPRIPCPPVGPGKQSGRRAN